MTRDTIISLLTLLISGLIIWTGSTALLIPGMYAGESPDWQLQAGTQDWINVCILVPFLLMVTVMISWKLRNALFLWAGALLYLTYTYLIYCFNVHFNPFFIPYCMILGLSVYSLLYFLYSHRRRLHYQLVSKELSWITGSYFIFTSLLFYGAWLVEIIPASVHKTVPESLQMTGLFTNPVHVIDLALFLPALFLSGVFLLKREPIGMFMAPILLTFMVLMDITIVVLMLRLSYEEMDTDLSLLTLMALKGIFSAFLLVLYTRNKIYAL